MIDDKLPIGHFADRIAADARHRIWRLAVPLFVGMIRGLGFGQVNDIPMRDTAGRAFSLRVLSDEVFKDKQKVVFRFYSAPESGIALHTVTVPDIDLTKGEASVEFQTSDKDDAQKRMLDLTDANTLYYTTQIATDSPPTRGESRHVNIVLHQPQPTQPLPGNSSPIERIGRIQPSARLQPAGTMVQIDNRGALPAVNLWKKDGLGNWQPQTIQSGEIRLVPGARISIQYIPRSSELPSAVRVYRNRTSGGNSSNGVANQEAKPIWAGLDNHDVPVARLDSGEARPTPRAWDDPTREVPAALVDTWIVGDWRGSSAGQKQDLSLVVPKDGNLTIVAHGGGEDFETKILAADPWIFKDDFEPYMALTHGSSLQFAVATKFKTFGINENVRVDTVAVFVPGATSTDDKGFLGAGLTWSPVWGSLYKTDGKPFFGFPLRFNLTIGLKGLTFEKHDKGSGQPFLGVGIQIPVGG